MCDLNQKLVNAQKELEETKDLYAEAQIKNAPMDVIEEIEELLDGYRQEIADLKREQKRRLRGVK